MTIAKFLLVLIVSIALSGCGTFNKQIVLHPIEKTDINKMQKGANYAPEKDGWFISDLYLKEVMQAKVEQVKRDS